MFRTIAAKIERDDDYPDRTYTLEIYSRILENAIYDHLPSGFHQEKSEAHEYVPLRDRRPSVKSGICRVVVDDSVALLFSEGHFPVAETEDEDAKQALADVIKDLRLNEIMMEAAITGSIGSVALHLRVLGQDDGSALPFVEVHGTRFLTPEYDQKRPTVLSRVREKYKVRGYALRDLDYEIAEKDSQTWFWFARDWDKNAETWYLPWKLSATPESDGVTAPYTIDTSCTVTHDLGFTPWLWVKNLPGRLKLLNFEHGRGGTAVHYSKCDGACTFAGAIDCMIEADYQLSQAGRGLKYSMDPQLMIREPAAPQDGVFVKSPANGLIVGEKGDAKMLEIEGSAFSVVLDYVRALREFALESTHGNRADPQKLATAQSGRAMELLNQSLVWLADRLRISYGEGALRDLLRMILAAHSKIPLTIAGKRLAAIKPDTEITLRWPAWYHPTAQDRMNTATTLKTHADAGHMSRRTAVATIAANFDVEDVDAELAAIEADAQRPRGPQLTLVPPSSPPRKS